MAQPGNRLDRAAAERRNAVNAKRTRTYAADFCPHFVEEIAQTLDMRLGSGVSYHGLSFRQNCSHHDIFCSGDARLVEKNVSAGKFFSMDLVTFAFDCVVCTQLLETYESAPKHPEQQLCLS